MAKFSQKNKLSPELRQKALLELCQAMVVVKNLPDAAKVLGDLLSEQELDMIAKRLQIAKLLLKEMTYEDIRKELNVSQHTIARVNLWLQQSGAGYRMILEKGSDIKPPTRLMDKGYTSDPWSSLKRRYPLYFWPQILIEEIVRGANERQRERLLGTLKTLRESGKGKKDVFRYIESMISVQRRERFKKS